VKIARESDADLVEVNPLAVVPAPDHRVCSCSQSHHKPGHD
jgi:succinyl-CoA synthetase beta subunit